MNKKKIVKDPVYGFITIPSPFVLQILDHPFVQRLRRIKQLGLADLVYPGSSHSRFNHALGAMHLMTLSLETLIGKGHKISKLEFEGAVLAILLHDLGHGPFSHVLEHSLVKGIEHESLSLEIMKLLDEEMDDERLKLAIEIFKGAYHRPFLNQLVTSQLDMDRLDYLSRDSFYTGVDEGVIGADRIIRMLNVVDDRLVVEEKGLYSIENFLSARRLMYWQVYLHRTALSVEKMLQAILERARSIGISSPSTALNYFLETNPKEKYSLKNEVIDHFLLLDDFDIWIAIKEWGYAEDKVLRQLSHDLLHRRLFKVEFLEDGVSKETFEGKKKAVKKALGLKKGEVNYFVSKGTISNAAYMRGQERIEILKKSGEIIDMADAADLPNIKAMSKTVKKRYFCYPKKVYLHA